MQIDVTVKLGKNGLVITQRVDSVQGASTNEGPVVEQNSLPAVFPGDPPPGHAGKNQGKGALPGGGLPIPNPHTKGQGGGLPIPNPHTKGQGGGLPDSGGGPVTIIGPIIFTCPPFDEPDTDEPKK